MIRLYCGDWVKTMKNFSECSIDLTVTSPPYDNLRTFGGSSTDFFWGFEDGVSELFRITKDHGVVVWVVGDTVTNGSESGTSFKQALYFKEMGFSLYDTMIYSAHKKPNRHRRYTQKFVYMFIFCKGGKVKTFNPIMEECLTAGKKVGVLNYRNKLGERLGRDDKAVCNKLKVKGNIWHYKTGLNCTTKDKIAFEHPAIFPDQLAIDHIKSWSNEGDVVLDPLMGSGTVGKMAKKLNRKFIGIELNSEYFKISAKRMGVEIDKKDIRISREKNI